MQTLWAAAWRRRTRTPSLRRHLVDVVFGTHNIGALPHLLERARHNHEAQAELLESSKLSPPPLRTKRDHVYSGWVSISVGCNNTCTFCIVPSAR